MRIHWVFNGCSEGLKASLQAYWQKKQPRLEKLLSPFRPDQRDLRLTVYYHAQPPRWEVRGVLYLPTRTLAAEEVEKDYGVALDRLVDTLAREVKRHKERLRRDYVFRRKSRRREELSAAGPLLERDVAQGRQQAFFDLLRPLLRPLHEHARREVRLLELEWALPKGEVTAADLVDEVLTRAWRRFAARPARQPLDLWLIDLLYEVVEQWRKQPPPLGMIGRGDGKAGQQEEPEWWAQLLDEAGPLSPEDLIPGADGNETWERLGAEEQRAWVHQLLAELPVLRRQAFVLHILEGFEPMEIAMLQDRPEADVAADIEAARQVLRLRLATVGRLIDPAEERAAYGEEKEQRVE